MRAVDRDVLLVAESGDGDVDPERFILRWLGFRIFDRPARLAVFLREFGRLLLSILGNTPFLDRLFPLSVLRCLGVATIVASTICSLIAKKPASRNAASNLWNKASAVFAFFNASRKAQILLASGTASEIPRPRKRMNDRRSLIR